MRWPCVLPLAVVFFHAAAAAEEPSGPPSAPCAGDPHACYLRAIRLEKQDPERALQLYADACEAGDPAGCGKEGAFLHEGRGAARDEGRALPLLRKACDADDAYACTTLGATYWEGDPSPADLERGVALFSRACDLEVMYCYGLARALENGWGVARDAKRAASLYTRTCERGNSGGCFRLGSMYVRGDGVAENLARGLGLWAKACREDEPAACNALVGVRNEACKKDAEACAEVQRGLEKACGGPGACPGL